MHPIRSAILRTAVALAALTVAAHAATLNVPSPFTRIQDAINAASNGDTVLVAPGTYFENINFNGKAITVTSSSGAATTIIDGQGITSVVTFNHGETRASTISNFTIRNAGQAATFAPASGIYMLDAAPTILDNVFLQNVCEGIDSEVSSPLIQGNHITQSLSPFGCIVGGGNGILLNSDDAFRFGLGITVTGNLIENNTAPEAGGGIYMGGGYGLPPVIENNTIRNNATGGQGGGIYMINSNMITLVQNLIYGNSAGFAGGVYILSPLLSSTGYGVIANNTITGNTTTIPAASNISDFYLDGELGAFVLQNNIIVGTKINTSYQCGDVYFNLSRGPVQIDHNDLYNSGGGTAFTGLCPYAPGSSSNISADPLFVNTSSFNLQLSSSSPGIDTGNSNALVVLPQDFNNAARIQNATGQGCIIDMGAYESAGTFVGCGTPTTTALTSSLNPAGFGVPVTFTATVTTASGTPTGSVTFTDGTTSLGIQSLIAGVAFLSTSSLGAGTHTITATYVPTGSFAGSSNSLTQTIIGVSTHTVLFANASAFIGNNTTFGVTVNLNGAGPTPTGTITLMEGATVLTTTPLIVAGGPSYGANPTLNNLSLGLHTITAIYSGDSSYNASTSNAVNITILINPTTLTLTASPNPAFATAGVDLTAQITSSTTTALPTGGTVTFLSNGSPIGSGTITASGAAFAPILPISNFSPGSYNLTASFAATTNFAASVSSPVTEVINITPTITTLTVTPNPGVQNQAERLVAEVSNPLAPSTVLLAPLFTYFDGSVSLGTSQNGLSISTLAPGTHTITAAYVGDTDFLPSTSAPVTLFIAPSDFTLTTTPTLTIQTEHHVSLNLTLTSIGGFTGDITFLCGPLPPIATCTFSSNPAHLDANATITPSVLIETDAVPYFKSELQHTGLTLAMLLPLTLLTLRRRCSSTRKISTHLLAILLTITTLSLTACSGKYPASTPPGTYNITVAALSQTTNIIHTANITFIVTP